jgi:hypothetical protein
VYKQEQAISCPNIACLVASPYLSIEGGRVMIKLLILCRNEINFINNIGISKEHLSIPYFSPTINFVKNAMLERARPYF